MTVILPYDGSAVARATARHLLRRLRGPGQAHRLVLLLAAAGRCAAHNLRGELRLLAAERAALTPRIVRGDIAATIARLRRAWPDAVCAAPLDLHGASAWYSAISRAVLTGQYGPCLGVLLTSEEPKRSPRGPSLSFPRRTRSDRTVMHGRRETRARPAPMRSVRDGASSLRKSGCRRDAGCHGSRAQEW